MKTMKKTICLLLCAVMLCSCCGFVLAAAAEEYDHLPQVYVCGIGSRKVYLKDDPDKISKFYPVDMDSLVGNLKNFDDYAAESLQNHDPNILYNCVYSWIWDTFGMIALEPDGITNAGDVAIDPCPLDYEGQGKYNFNYDSRLDPVDLAHQLHEYIGWVQEDSGSERFEFVGSSYGASILLAYMNEYREEWKNVDSIVLCVPSTGGVDFVGELFTGSFDIDPDVIQDFLKVMVGNEELDLLLSVLNKSKALSKILDYFLEPTLRVVLMDALTAVIHDIFGTLPSVWSFVQDKYFYQALKRIYGKDYANPNHEYAVLIQKIIYYHEQVMVKAPELLKAFQKSGIPTNIICKYGQPPIPLSETGNVMSDGVVDLAVASYGATCSMRGRTLPARYKQALYPEYDFLSADGCVDASTCVLPFNTWFVKGLEHGQKTSDYFNLINLIAYHDLDVFSDPAHPQFLELSSDENTLLPLSKPEPEKETTLFQDAISLAVRVLNLLVTRIKGLFQ